MSISMTQAVALGIVIVDGPPGSSAAFTDDERLTIAVEISQGFDILYQLSESAAVPTNPHLLFVAETQRVTLSVDPATIPAPTGNAAPAEYAPCETPWRDAALAALGFPAGAAGVSTYVQTLMSKAWPVAVTPGSACVVFITKYNAAWMAYTDPSFLWQVIQFPWVTDKSGAFVANKQGWGSENIDRVFAHETGHVAGAPDEYFPVCSATATFGSGQIPNGNCQTVANGNANPCLMFNNTSAMCQFTPKHWGWVSGP